MSLDFTYIKAHAPVIPDIMQALLAVGWALLLGNLVFQALRSMASGLGFEGEDPKMLFARSFVFAFLLLGSSQGVFFLEFDGPRSRRCQVMVMAAQ